MNLRLRIADSSVVVGRKGTYLKVDARRIVEHASSSVARMARDRPVTER